MNGRRSRQHRAAEAGLTVKGAKLLEQLDREREHALRELAATYDKNRAELEAAYFAAQEHLANAYMQHSAAIYHEHSAS